MPEEAIFNLDSEDKEEFSRRVGGRRGKKELRQGKGSSSTTAHKVLLYWLWWGTEPSILLSKK